MSGFMLMRIEDKPATSMNVKATSCVKYPGAEKYHTKLAIERMISSTKAPAKVTHSFAALLWKVHASLTFA